MDTKDKKRQARPVPAKTPRRKPASQHKVKANTAYVKADVAVVYTDAKPFNRNRFLLRLATVVAVVLALVLGMTIFFKVENITVSGMEKYSAWDIRQASGIREGENLLTLSKAQVSGRITTALPYVQYVRVAIQLPDTVNIEVTELDVAYAVEAQDNSWWLIDADGKVVESVSSTEAKGHTQILGVQLAAPTVGAQAVAAEPVPEETGEEGQTVPVTVTGSERLQTVISILQYLEDNSIIGQAASLDVTSLNHIELWYEDRYQVNLGDTTQLAFKIQSMKKAIDQEKDYQSGMLDVSFSIWPDQVGYTPFQ